MSLLLELALLSRGKTALVAATVAAEEVDSVKGGAGANAGGASCGEVSLGLLRAFTGPSDGKKRDEKDGGNGDSPAVVTAGASLAGAVTEYSGREESLSLSFGDKRVATDKPSDLGACVRDKVPVCCRLLTQMKPRRGKGANRRGSQSVDRERVQVTVWPRALNVDTVERIARRFGAVGLGRWSSLGACGEVGMAWSLHDERHLGLARLSVSCPGSCDGAHNTLSKLHTSQ